MKILILLTIIGVMVPLLGLEFQALDSLRAFFYLWTPLLLAWVIVIFYQVFKLLMHGLNRLHEKRRPN